MDVSRAGGGLRYSRDKKEFAVEDYYSNVFGTLPTFADLQAAVLHQDVRDRAAPLLHLGLDDPPAGVPAEIGLQILELGLVIQDLQQFELRGDRVGLTVWAIRASGGSSRKPPRNRSPICYPAGVDRLVLFTRCCADRQQCR